MTQSAARRIEERVPVPVLDGKRAAIPLAEALVRVGARKPTTGSYAAPGQRATAAIDPALSLMLSKRQ
jgi:allantoin racemase